MCFFSNNLFSKVFQNNRLKYQKWKYLLISYALNFKLCWLQKMLTVEKITRKCISAVFRSAGSGRIFPAPPETNLFKHTEMTRIQFVLFPLALFLKNTLFGSKSHFYPLNVFICEIKMFIPSQKHLNCNFCKFYSFTEESDSERKIHIIKQREIFFLSRELYTNRNSH